MSRDVSTNLQPEPAPWLKDPQPGERLAIFAADWPFPSPDLCSINGLGEGTAPKLLYDANPSGIVNAAEILALGPESSGLLEGRGRSKETGLGAAGPLWRKFCDKTVGKGSGSWKQKP